MNDFFQALSNCFSFVEILVGRLLLLSIGIVVVCRICIALYHLTGMTCFGLLCRKYMTEKKGGWTALAMYPLLFWNFFKTGSGPDVDIKGWTKRSDGKKVQAFTWRGGFDWTINDPDECPTRNERMDRRGSHTSIEDQ